MREKIEAIASEAIASEEIAETGINRKSLAPIFDEAHAADAPRIDDRPASMGNCPSTEDSKPKTYPGEDSSVSVAMPGGKPKKKKQPGPGYVPMKTLASEFGVSDKTIAAWRNGKDPSPENKEAYDRLFDRYFLDEKGFIPK